MQFNMLVITWTSVQFFIHIISHIDLEYNIYILSNHHLCAQVQQTITTHTYQSHAFASCSYVNIVCIVTLYIHIMYSEQFENMKADVYHPRSK